MAEGRPGLFRMAGALIRAPFERAMLEEANTRSERLAIEASTRVLSEIVRRVEPEEDGWIPIGSVGKRDLNEAEAVDLREAAQRAALENPHAIGYLKSLKRFVLGKGAAVHIEHEDADVKQAADGWFAEFARWNKWDTLEDEIAWRAWRDGETFVRKFDEPPAVDVAASVAALLARAGTSAEELAGEQPPEGMVFLRLVPPEHVADPSGVVTHGIITAAADVGTVLGYCYAPDGRAVKEIIPAEEIEHVRVGVDSDIKRGRSVLAALLKRMKQFEDWLNYRITLNLARTAVVLIKTVQGSPAQVQAIRDGQEKSRADTGNDRKTKMLKPMTTFVASPGISYEFKSPNINAPDAKDDGRAILLTMAAATGLPEYMFTGDASNANFASTMVAESPAVREFEDWQDFFTPVWQRIYRWVVVAGARAGQIEGLTEEEARTIPLVVEWPPLLARDEDKKAVANKARFEGGVLSREGWARDDGIDWDVELERLKREAADPLSLTPDAMLKLIIAAATSGVLSPDAGLEAKVRELVGLPALLGEEPPLDGEPLPALPEPERLSAPPPPKIQIEVAVAAAVPKGPPPKRIILESITRDEDGAMVGAVLAVAEPEVVDAPEAE